MFPNRLRNCRFHWLFVALLLFVPVNAKADALPAADYQKNLQRAIAAVESLQQVDETATPYYYKNELDQTLATIREVLPEHQPVQASDDVCNVDNSWLHAALKDVEAASPERRPAKLTEVVERLKALEQQVGYERKAATPADSKAQGRDKLESILARPEYATEARGPNALTRLLQDFIRWLQQFFPERMQPAPGRVGWLNVIVQVAVVAIALLVLVYVAKTVWTRFGGARRRHIPKKRKARIILGERLEPEDTATDLLSEAEVLARRGDLRAAIRKAYIALLVELGDRKVITLAQYKTNRDYLNAVRNIPLLHSTMYALTDSFERHWYGFAEASENDWRNFRTRYQAVLQTQN